MKKLIIGIITAIIVVAVMSSCAGSNTICNTYSGYKAHGSYLAKYK